MPLVHNTVHHPIDGTPAENAKVTVSLVAALVGAGPGYQTPTGTVQGYSKTTTDDDGFWSAELVANTDLSPADTFYEVEERVPGHPPIRHDIAVPEAAETALNGPHALPLTTITVDATAGFEAATADSPRWLVVGGQLVSYTGMTATTFTGASGGTGTIADNATVTQAFWVGYILNDPPATLPTLHLLDPTDAHDASAISVAPGGNLAATNAQAALLELDGQDTTEAAARAAADTTEATNRAAGDTALADDLATEATARAAGDTALTTAINTEVTNRTNAVTAEASARTVADAAIADDLADETAARIAADTASGIGLANETAAREAADDTLTGGLDDEITGRTNADNAEAATRAAADTTLTTNLTAETNARTAADTTLTNNLTAEVTNRVADVDTEEAARIAAVSAEATTRAAADTTLTTNLAAESTARTAADTTLTNNLDAEVSDRATAVAAEATARTAADTTLTNNLAAEVTNRTADVNAEEAARIAAVATEVSDRATADNLLGDLLTDEIGDRTAGDVALADDIGDEITRAVAAEGVLAADISGLTVDLGVVDIALAAEVTNRVADVDTEEAARIAADALKVDKATLNANSVLVAVTDDTPAALAVPASTVVGRKATGDVAALTGAELVELVPPATYVGIAGAETVTGAKRFQGGKPWYEPESLAELTAAITAAAAAGSGIVRVAVPIALGATSVIVPNGVVLQCVGKGEFTYTGTGVAVTFDGQENTQSSVVRIRRTNIGWEPADLSDTTSVGVELKNCLWGTYTIVECQNFETGLLLHGDPGGTSLNNIHLGRLNDNKRGIRLTGANGGYANQNTFYGGVVRISNFGGTAGSRYVDLGVGNGNTFVGVNLEGLAPEETVYDNGVSNAYLNCRWETSTKLHFGPASRDNLVLFGIGNQGAGGIAPNLVVQDESGLNHVIGTANGGQLLARAISMTGALVSDSTVRAEADSAAMVSIGAFGPGGEAGMAFGPSLDASFYRRGAGFVGLLTNLLIDGILGVGNWQAASAVGAINGVVELRKSADNSFAGYVPTYGTFTP